MEPQGIQGKRPICLDCVKGDAANKQPAPKQVEGHLQGGIDHGSSYQNQRRVAFCSKIAFQ